MGSFCITQGAQPWTIFLDSTHRRHHLYRSFCLTLLRRTISGSISNIPFLTADVAATWNRSASPVTPLEISPRLRERLPSPVFWPGEFQELYSPWGCKRLTEQLSLSCGKAGVWAAALDPFPCVFPALVWGPTPKCAGIPMGHIHAHSEDPEELSGLVKTEPSPKGGGPGGLNLHSVFRARGTQHSLCESHFTLTCFSWGPVYTLWCRAWCRGSGWAPGSMEMKQLGRDLPLKTSHCALVSTVRVASVWLKIEPGRITLSPWYRVFSLCVKGKRKHRIQDNDSQINSKAREWLICVHSL